MIMESKVNKKKKKHGYAKLEETHIKMSTIFYYSPMSRNINYVFFNLPSGMSDVDKVPYTTDFVGPYRAAGPSGHPVS